MKKLFAALLTLCMVFGMAVPAFAAGDPLTIRFYYGGADYGRYKEGWIDVGNIDTGAGRFYAAINFGDEEIGGDINPADKSITGSHDLIGSAWLYYDVEATDSSSFSVALPKGPSYHYPGSEYSPPETTEFAAWVVSDGNGGYKELEGSVTAEDVQNAIVTDEEGKRVAVIKAAFPAVVIDKNALTYEETGHPKYAVILRANGGTFAEDGSDHLYVCPQSLEYSALNDFFVEASCPKPSNGDMVFAGWYKDEACTDGPVTYLNINDDLKEEPAYVAPYVPMDLYARWEPAGFVPGNTSTPADEPGGPSENNTPAPSDNSAPVPSDEGNSNLPFAIGAIAAILLFGLLTLLLLLWKGPVTLSFYYGGADYGSYKDGLVNLGRVDTKAGKLQAVYRYLDPETKTWKTLVGTINPEDKSIDNDDPRLLKGKLYYNRKPFLRLKFSVPLPDGVDYHFPGGEGAEPVTVSFAAWMVKDGNGGYKALEDPVTSKAVKPAVETEKVKRRKVLITAAFRSEMADEYALNDENGNPRYAVRLHANGGAFEADGTDLLYMKPRSLEFADQELFYVEATCLKPTSSGKVFTGWYRDKACTAGPVTGLKILEELKERPVREAPYAPMDLYAKWETQES